MSRVLDKHPIRIKISNGKLDDYNKILKRRVFETDLEMLCQKWLNLCNERDLIVKFSRRANFFTTCHG